MRSSLELTVEEHDALRLSSSMELTAVVGRLPGVAMTQPNHPRSSSGGRLALEGIEIWIRT